MSFDKRNKAMVNKAIKQMIVNAPSVDPGLGKSLMKNSSHTQKAIDNLKDLLEKRLHIIAELYEKLELSSSFDEKTFIGVVIASTLCPMFHNEVTHSVLKKFAHPRDYEWLEKLWLNNKDDYINKLEEDK